MEQRASDYSVAGFLDATWVAATGKIGEFRLTLEAMLAAVIGGWLVIASLIAPRFGFGLFRGRPGGGGRRQIDNSLSNRIATAIIGLLMILFGLSDFYPK
jgi:hypothetical protein